MVRGGSRLGAGRKRKGQGKRMAISLTLEEGLLETLSQEAQKQNVSISDLVNQALAKTFILKSPQLPTSLDFSRLIFQRWHGYTINRRSNEVQFWRRLYKSDAEFRKALDLLVKNTCRELQGLILDGKVFSAPYELIALANSEHSFQVHCLYRLLQGKSLLQAVEEQKETFRQSVIEVRKIRENKDYYYFFEEL